MRGRWSAVEVSGDVSRGQARGQACGRCSTWPVPRAMAQGPVVVLVAGPCWYVIDSGRLSQSGFWDPCVQILDALAGPHPGSAASKVSSQLAQRPLLPRYFLGTRTRLLQFGHSQWTCSSSFFQSGSLGSNLLNTGTGGSYPIRFLCSPTYG